MILPKLTRQRLYAAKGQPIEITIPEGEQCGELKRYGLQSSRGGKRLATIFIQTLEHRGDLRVATAILTDQPEFMAPVSGSTPDASRSIDPDAEKVPAHYQKQIDTEARARFEEASNTARRQMRESGSPYFMAWLKTAAQERAVRQQMRRGWVMCSPTEYIPHREAEPLRLCAGCGALLASRNETATCWQCDPYWSDVDLDEARSPRSSASPSVTRSIRSWLRHDHLQPREQRDARPLLEGRPRPGHPPERPGLLLEPALQVQPHRPQDRVPPNMGKTAA
jgi:hypothetical protein